MVWIMVLVAVGIIIGNLMLLRHTAHMKMPLLKDKQQRHSDDQDAWDNDDWNKD
ncbi:MAG: DUF2897 family protein [Gammaproteobacteria bacterium]|nr:DUF2897 family protein [Gammaproteobacteria bacterium]